jgi:hypothetical protein
LFALKLKNLAKFVVSFTCFSREKKVSWKIQWNFQDTLATKFPSIELVIGGDGQNLCNMRCKIYIEVEHSINFWCPSWMGSINIMGKGNEND